MKHWTLSVIAALCLLAGCAARTPEQQIRHDDVKYGSALSVYQRDLKPGASRKEVEDYLRGRNISFSQMCCWIAPHASRTLDDMVFLRTEHRPWPCGTADVYIGFVFDDQPNQLHTRKFEADDADTLVGIHILKMMDCE
jgi:hypothetical protein